MSTESKTSKNPYARLHELGQPYFKAARSILQADPDALVVGLGSTAADVAGLIGIATNVAVAVPRDVVFSAVLQARGGGGPEVMAGFGPGDLMVMAEGALVVFQYAGSASSHRDADFTPTYWAGLRACPIGPPERSKQEGDDDEDLAPERAKQAVATAAHAATVVEHGGLHRAVQGLADALAILASALAPNGRPVPAPAVDGADPSTRHRPPTDQGPAGT